MKTLPQIGKSLEKEHLDFLKAFAKSCRKSIMEMLINSQSGHPGGSLSSLDYLAAIYTLIVSQTGEKVVVSNGHISPAVYSVLGEMGYTDKNEAIKTFRKAGSHFEGHITRHIDGVTYGTGPLGIGVSVASSFALAEKMEKTEKKVFALMGDGEVQEGQVHEMIQFSKHHKLDNLILFVDYNQVQLTSSLKEIQDIDVQKIFEGGHWHVINIDAHNFSDIWAGLSAAYLNKGTPTVILGHSIMGKGVEALEIDGRAYKSTWHGKAPKAEESEKDLKDLKLSEEEESLIKNFLTLIKWHPEKTKYPKLLSEVKINTGTPILYDKDNTTDCRTAYGKALVDMAKFNLKVVALTADLKTSVMTKFVSEERPEQYIECGIGEQNMVSMSGGLSLNGYVPFCSTFGAFMSSRAKDQARVNDINYCNVKMVATHCGLSVGEDGPTHQAIDDAGSFLGMFNTMTLEPADPNQTDRMIRYAASHYGNFYVRMGRHKIPSILKEDGTIFYGTDYKYEYGKCDLLREGKSITIAAMGSLVTEALKAFEILKKQGVSAEIVVVSSIKKFDDTLIKSIKKTGKVLTVEDHNTLSGLGATLARHLESNEIKIEKYEMLGVESYQLSGKPEELYEMNGLAANGIAKTCAEILK